MVKREHLVKLKKILSSAAGGINLAQSLLCSIALGDKLVPSLYDDKKTSEVFRGLRRYRFIRHIKEKGSNIYHLTPKGETKLHNLVVDEIEVKTPKSWDRKWRLVMYDLPIRFKKARNAFRFKLKDLGFFQFQKSAWIYPYPCEGEILFIADFYGVRKHIEILEIDKILDDRRIKSYFGLYEKS